MRDKPRMRTPSKKTATSVARSRVGPSPPGLQRPGGAHRDWAGYCPARAREPAWAQAKTWGGGGDLLGLIAGLTGEERFGAFGGLADFCGEEVEGGGIGGGQKGGWAGGDVRAGGRGGSTGGGYGGR